jgi:hypothetical protein
MRQTIDAKALYREPKKVVENHLDEARKKRTKTPTTSLVMYG